MSKPNPLDALKDRAVALGRPLTLDEGLTMLAARPRCPEIRNGAQCRHRIHDGRMGCVFIDVAAEHDRMRALIREEDAAQQETK